MAAVFAITNEADRLVSQRFTTNSLVNCDVSVSTNMLVSLSISVRNLWDTRDLVQLSQALLVVAVLLQNESNPEEPLTLPPFNDLGNFRAIPI